MCVDDVGVGEGGLEMVFLEECRWGDGTLSVRGRRWAPSTQSGRGVEVEGISSIAALSPGQHLLAGHISPLLFTRARFHSRERLHLLESSSSALALLQNPLSTMSMLVLPIV